MTEVEREAATGYWQTRRSAGAGRRRTPWPPGTGSASRSASRGPVGWSRSSTRPGSTAGSRSRGRAAGWRPGARDRSGGLGRPGLARCLPDRWAVVGFSRGQRVLLHWGAPVPPELQVSLDDVADLGTGSARPASSGSPTLPRPRPPAWRCGSRWRRRSAGTSTGCWCSASAPPNRRRRASRTWSVGSRAKAASALAFSTPGAPTNNTEWSAAPIVPCPWTTRCCTRGCSATRPARARGGGIRSGWPARWAFTSARSAGSGRGARRGGAGPGHPPPALVLPPSTTFCATRSRPPSLRPPIRFAQDFFLAQVRPQGPLPLLQDGAQPYGVLPVLALDRWRLAGSDARATVLVNWLRSLRNAIMAFGDVVGPLAEQRRSAA